MTEIGRTSLAGVRVFFADGPPPLVGAILFRVGRADEQASSGEIAFGEVKQRDVDAFLDVVLPLLARST